MNWDPQGRLWVASSALYPQIAPGGEETDKIIVLEDPDHSGKATKSTVFADGLLLPTGIAPAAVPTPRGRPQRYGCFVGQSTEAALLRGHQGRPAGPTSAAHRALRLRHGRYAPHSAHAQVGPGWPALHGPEHLHPHPHGNAVGRGALELRRLPRVGPAHGKTRSPRQGVLDQFLGPSVWDPWGQSFFTDGAGNGGINWAFPGAQFVTYEGARRILPSISPGTYPKFTSAYRAHSVPRASPPTGRAMPSLATSARIASCASASPICAKGMPLPKSGYVTKEMPDVVRTSDVAFRPIDVKLGPDGALVRRRLEQPGDQSWRSRFPRSTPRPHPWPHLAHHEKRRAHGAMGRPHEKDHRRSVLTLRPARWKTRIFGCANSPCACLGDETVFASRECEPRISPRPTNSGALRTDESAADSILRTAPRRFHTHERPRHCRGSARLCRWSFGRKNRPDPAHAALASRHGGNRLSRSTRQTPRLPRPTARHARSLRRASAPRVRLGAVRVLGAIPTAESATLVLNVAAKNDGSDSFLDYATWLSINDLAKPWTEAIASGAWKTEGREKQLEYGLNAIDPALAGKAGIAKILSRRQARLHQGGRGSNWSARAQWTARTQPASSRRWCSSMARLLPRPSIPPA